MKAPRKKITQLETWYRQEMPRLYNYIAYQVADQKAAEDIVAMVCERGLKRLHQYDPGRGTFTVWMFGIARNTLNDYFRENSKRFKEISLKSLPQIQGQGDTPEEQLIKAERFKQIILLLDHLTESEREVLALRYASDLKYQEIADVMSTSANHIGVLIHRALGKLKDALNEREMEEEYASR